MTFPRRQSMMGPGVANVSERAREYYRIATWAFIGLAAVYSILLRLYLMWDLPLWYDESWTAVLSAAPDLATLFGYMRIDINAPLYSVLMWLWPFESSLGLKIPTMVFLLATAALAVLWRPAAISRETALVWTALLLLWQPGIGLFIDARYYTLLMLLSTAQTIAFIRLLDQPTLRGACWWAGLSVLAVLTHYYAALPALIQGLAYLWRHRMAAARTWPALLLLLPGAAWGVYHLPVLLAFSRPGVAWYTRVKLVDLPDLLSWPVANNWVAALGMLAIIGVFWKRDRIAPSVMIAVAGSLVALLCFILLGSLRSLLTARYLIPVVPALLLGVASAVRPAGYLPLFAWLFVNLGGPVQWTQHVANVRGYGLEFPARSLPKAKRVTWIFGSEAASSATHRHGLEAMLTDAFKRHGRVVEARYGGNPMAGDGLIWLIYQNNRPLSDKVRAAWNCRTFGTGYYSTLVCSRPH